MRMLTGRVGFEKPGFNFNLDDARPAGPQTVIRAAKDPIAREPEDARIKALLVRTLCRGRLADDRSQWEISGVTGQVYMLSLGAPYELWETACTGLLNQAMNEKTDGS